MRGLASELAIGHESTSTNVFQRRWSKYRRARAIIAIVVALISLSRLLLTFVSIIADPHWTLAAVFVSLVVVNAGTLTVAWFCIRWAVLLPSQTRAWRAVVMLTWIGIAASMAAVQLKCKYLDHRKEVSELYSCRAARVGLVSGSQLTTITGWTLVSAALFHVGTRHTCIGTSIMYLAVMISSSIGGINVLMEVRGVRLARVRHT